MHYTGGLSVSATRGDHRAPMRRSKTVQTFHRREARLLGDPARIWWLNPASLLLFIILPIFGSAILLASPIMATFGAHNFLSAGPILLAMTALLALAFGSVAGETVARSWSSNRVALPYRVITAIAVLALISIAAHLMLLGAILSKPSVAVAVLAGHKGAIYVAKQLMMQIPGVTSFTQLFLIALPLYGILPHLTGQRPPIWLRNIVAILIVLLLARALLTAERFTLVEAAISLIVPRIAFSLRIPPSTNLLPLWGFAGMVFLFCVGEFTRSWAYHKYQYSSFLEFCYTRLVGYLATATNNGAGVLETTGPIYAPLYTANWYHSLPLWSFIDNPITPANPLVIFFQTYGNGEFNNPGGMLSPILDYGIAGGMFMHFAFGMVTGILFSRFRRMDSMGVILFPIFFLGMMIINQAYYWTNARVFLPIVLSVPVYFYITRIQTRQA